MVLDASLPKTQHYMIRIKGKVEQSKERNGVLHYTSVLLLLKREPLVHPRLRIKGKVEQSKERNSVLHYTSVLLLLKREPLVHPRLRLLYVSKKEERRGFAGIEDCVDASIKRIEDYIKKSKERWITETDNRIGNIWPDRKNKNQKENKKQKWEEKQLLWDFNRQTDGIAHEKTWRWLRKGHLKIETESFQIVEQNAIRTNYIKAKIDHMFRIYGEKGETVNYIISRCCKLAQK